MSAVIAIIPARLASTRFPRKVLANVTGKPLVQHVYERAAAAACVSRVLVATDALEVFEAVRSWGGEAVMTGEHPNGTSRVAEAARLLGLADTDIVVNVQGDEPEVDPDAIDDAVGTLRSSGADVATLATPFSGVEETADPNLVKVVRARDGTALYFSRSPIPFLREGGALTRSLRHVGLYVYSVRMLWKYVQLPPTPLEQSEMLEQLRLLEHGMRIAVAVCDCAPSGIDTPEQYAAFVERHRQRR